VAAQSKTWDCGPPLAWDNGFDSRRWHGCLFLVVVCCQVELTAKGRSFVQVSPTECGVCLDVIKGNSNLYTYSE
jgi:hypothetical protein